MRGRPATTLLRDARKPELSNGFDCGRASNPRQIASKAIHGLMAPKRNGTRTWP